MRAVDTNVVARYLVGDDAAQAARARAVIEGGAVFVARTVLLEVEWVLRGVYGFAAARVTAALRGFAGLEGVTVEDAPLVARALDWAAAGMDFADALHVAAADGCDGFVTFDKRLVRAGRKLAGVDLRGI